MVVPRIATRTEKNALDHSTLGTSVAYSASRQSTRATNAVTTYARRTSVSHLNTRAIARYDHHISSTTMAMPYAGTVSAVGAPVTRRVAAAMPPRSAAILMMLATTSSAHAPQSTTGE